MLQFDLKNNPAIYQLIAGIVAVALIVIGCIVILTPFFPAMLLATIFALATWPAYDWISKKLGHRKNMAAGLMTLMLALCFILPVVIIGSSVAENFGAVAATIQKTLNSDPERAVQKIRDIPVAGEHLARLWAEHVGDAESLTQKVKGYSGAATKNILTIGSVLGKGLFDISLGVIIAYFLFRHGNIVADRAAVLIDTFGGTKGKHLLDVCKNTLIGVVYGLMGTALMQGAFAALGFWIAGVPGATFLGLLVFFLSLVPVGPPMVWIPAAFWLYGQGETGWAIFLVIWGAAVVGAIDNVMKPYFISRGSNLPLLLVLLGIMGGVLAFGFIGVFIGPTLLALAYSLILEWSSVRQAARAGAENAASAKPKTKKLKKKPA